MLSLALTRDQTVAINFLSFFGSCPYWRCSHDEWQELVQSGYCWLDGWTYRAHETYATPDFEMCEPDKRGSTSAAADRQFEEGRWHLFEEGRLQL